jgi:hypothetical protein
MRKRLPLAPASVLVLAGALLLTATAAHADGHSSPTTSKGEGLNFDFFGDSTKSSPPDAKCQAELDAKVKRRRRMLQAHQAFGFITLGLLGATLVVGQINYDDKFSRDGTYSGVYQLPHLGLAAASAATFMTTGLLALLAPNPYAKPIKADAALVHKVMMGLATAGMVTQLILGPISSSREGKLEQRDFALGHLAMGYATFVLMAAGALAYVF